MILWCVAAFTAYFVKGLCGFANTLVFTTILSFGAANASISPVDLLLGYPANLVLTWKNRRSLDPAGSVGMKCCGRMNENSIRKITTVLLVLSGISLVLKNL